MKTSVVLEKQLYTEVCIGYCICDKLTINFSEYKIELDRINVQRVVVNETALTTSPYQLANQSPELFGVARPPADKAPSAARLAPHDGSKGNSEPTRVLNIHIVIFSCKQISDDPDHPKIFYPQKFVCG